MICNLHPPTLLTLLFRTVGQSSTAPGPKAKASALSPEEEEALREQERLLLSEKFDVILTKLDAIDRLENVQVS